VLKNWPKESFSNIGGPKLLKNSQGNSKK